MKKINLLFLGILILVLSVSCATNLNTNTAKFEISDEALARREEFWQAGEKNLLKEGVIEKVIEKSYGRGEQVLPAFEAKSNLTHETCDGYNVYAYDKGTYSNIVLYIHGGAWTFGISNEHLTFCDQLTSVLDAKVYMPLYPLAPDYCYEDAYKMLEDLYLNLLKQGKPVYVMGDSAGGNLALCLTHQLKEKGYDLPSKLVLLAPCADMSFSNPDMEEIDKNDPILTPYGCRECAKHWANGIALDSPILSPLYCDVTGFPETMLIVGTYDILYADVIPFNKKLNDAGVKTSLVVGEGLWHVFSTYDIPEQKQSLDLIKQFIFGK